MSDPLSRLRIDEDDIAYRIRIRCGESLGWVWDWFRFRLGGAVRFQFGDCILDRHTHELLRGGRVLHIEPKAFHLLELLVEARPKALSKDELQDALWPKTFISERSLARLISLLRDEIGDRADEPRFIRTVHGFGYAFCGEATPSDEAGSTGAEPDVSCRLIWGDREIALAEGENVLGRDKSVSVWIDSNSVSRRHVRIVVSGASAKLEDLGSKNSTYLNGKRVSAPALLSSGDQIKIGSALLVFRCFRRQGTTQSEIEK